MILLRKTAIVSCVIFCWVHSGSESLRTERFTGLTRSGYKLGVDNTASQVNTDSAIQCSAICLSSANCRTISWNEEQKLCLLGSSDVTHDYEAFNNMLDQDAAWNTLSLMEYTVFVGWNSSWVPMSLQMGRDLCTMRHTVIASLSDLSYSQSRGFIKVRCTWLSEGTIRYAANRQSIVPCSTSSNPFVLCILN